LTTRGLDDTSKSLSLSILSSWAAVDDVVVACWLRVDINVSSFSVSLSHTITPAAVLVTAINEVYSPVYVFIIKTNHVRCVIIS